MKNVTESIQARRQAHHKALEALALEVGCRLSGKALWRGLNRLERSLYPVCLDYTNGIRGVGLAQWQAAKADARKELTKLFGGTIPAGIRINGDPRGSMLKLDCGSAGEPGRAIPEGMEKDWGGDGILAAVIEKEEA